MLYSLVFLRNLDHLFSLYFGHNELVYIKVVTAYNVIKIISEKLFTGLKPSQKKIQKNACQELPIEIDILHLRLCVSLYFQLQSFKWFFKKISNKV